MLINEQALYSINELIPLIIECIEAGNEVKMKVSGISMTPTLIDRRDSVILTGVGKIKKYDIVMHRRGSGQYILHRVVDKKGDILGIAGDYETELEYPVHISQVVARVEGFERKGKYYSCNNILYQIYSRIWVLVFPLRHKILKLYGLVRRICHGKGKRSNY